jgi:hypothetical protein
VRIVVNSLPLGPGGAEAYQSAYPFCRDIVIGTGFVDSGSGERSRRAGWTMYDVNTSDRKVPQTWAYRCLSFEGVLEANDMLLRDILAKKSETK